MKRLLSIILALCMLLTMTPMSFADEIPEPDDGEEVTEHIHSFGEWQQTTAPTCTEKGVETRYCSDCEVFETRDVDELGHDIEHHEAKTPTCTEIGWDAYDTCKRCEYTTYKEIAALDHDIEHHEAKAATCTEKGWEAYDTCKRCEYTTYKEIAALDHDIVHHEAKAATCTEKGWEAYDTCKRCDYTTYKEIAATDHDYGEATYTWSADGKSCTATRVCKNDASHIETAAAIITSTEAKAPSCTEMGSTLYTATFDVDWASTRTQTVVDIAALDHDIEHHEAKAATCTEIGWEAFDTCSRCDYTTYKEIAALDHDIVHHEAKAATCTEIGWEAYDTCSRCDYTTYKEIAALDHDIVHHEAKAATCTEIGWEAYDTCSRCDYTTYKEIPATDHNFGEATYKWSADGKSCTATRVCKTDASHVETVNAVITSEAAKAPTCTEMGSTLYTATFAASWAETKTQTVVDIAATGHDYVHHEAKAPTCTEHGWEAYDTCSRCDYTTYKEISETGHSLEEWVTLKAPSCTEKGIKIRYCANCEYYETDDIEPTGHSGELRNVKAPSCTEKGYTGDIVCIFCEEILERGDEIAPLGHTFGEWTVTTQESCTEKGTETRWCSVCGTADTRDIEPHGHSHSGVVTAPTCTEKGYTTYTCAECGDSYKADWTDALGHDFGKWTEKIPAGCITEGEEIRCCSRCDAFETQATAALGHSFEKTVTAPGCTAEGYTTYTCTVCGFSYTSDYTSPVRHAYGDWTVTKAQGCTEKGSETCSCEHCGDVRTRAIAPTGHHYTDKVTAPSCTNGGYTTHSCACGDSYTDDYTDPLGHDYSEWIVSKAPTCTEKGKETRYCTVCGAIQTRGIAATGHHYTDTVVAPTCTEEGYTTHTCSCGDSYTDSYVSALGHSWDDGVITKYAGKGTTGIKTYTCTVCGVTRTETIPHADHDHSFEAKVIAPTCTEKGCTIHTCSVCGESYSDSVTDKLPHSYGEWKVTKAAGCTEKGEETRYCSGCDAFETRELAAHGHNYVETVTAPTCTEKGYTTHVCSYCHDSFTDSEKAALGHSSEIRNKKNATCTEKGYTGDEVCKVCGTVLKRGSDIAASGHSYEKKVTNPTCTAQGYTTHTCSKCGNSYKDSYTSVIPHSYTTTVVAAKTEARGYTKHTCKVCGSSYNDSYTVAAPVTAASTVASTGKVYVCWEAVDGAAKYEIYLSSSADSGYSLLKTVTSTKYTSTYSTPGYTYYFKIKSVMSDGTHSDFSKAAHATCVLAQPNVKLSVLSSSGKPKLSWDKVSNASKYEVYRATSKTGTYTKLTTDTETSFTDTSAKPGKTYYYKVKAIYSKSKYGNSPYSEIKTAVCTCAKPSVKISTSTSGKPTLTWSAVTGATKYEIWRATSKDGKYSKLSTTTKTSYTNTGAVVGKTYYYKVRAMSGTDASVGSAYSTAKSIMCICASPSVKITTSNGYPKLSWSKVTGATKYEVYRATSSGGKYTRVTTTSQTSYTNMSASKGKTYYYKVKAISSSGSLSNSAYSKVVSIKAK